MPSGSSRAGPDRENRPSGLASVAELPLPEGTAGSSASHLDDQVPGAAWSVDRDLTVTWIRGRDIETLCRSSAGVVGRSLQELFETSDRDASPIKEHLSALEGSAVAFEMTRGRSLWAVCVEPLRGSAGTVVGAVAAALDVTAIR